MAQLLPKFKAKYGKIGVELFFQFPDLSDYPVTYLDADEAASQSTLSANGTGFSTGQYIVIGMPGSEKTEIIRIHTSTTPSSTVITLASSIAFAHSRGEPIRFIPFNQIEPSRSTDSGSNYSALTAIDIRADATETYLQRASDSSTDYYKFRFYNSADATYSAYSDATIATGFADNSVYAIKHRALRAVGEKINDLITDEFLNEQLGEARREIDNTQLRWKFRTKFNQDVGTVIPGRWAITVPSDLRDPDTNNNILALRIGRMNIPLLYQDINRFNENYYNVAHSTLNGAITTGSTSVILTSSGDFDESGNVDIAAESLATTVDSVAYTANNESTNTLSGVTGIGENHASGRDVWQGATFGLPQAYTVNDGSIYFEVPFENDLAGENIWMDYYSVISATDSDGDTLDEPHYDLYTNYLKWKIKELKSNGTLKKEDDSDYQIFKEKKKTLIDENLLGQRIRLIPD